MVFRTKIYKIDCTTYTVFLLFFLNVLQLYCIDEQPQELYSVKLTRFLITKYKRHKLLMFINVTVLVSIECVID